MNWQQSFPKNLRNHERFPELEKLVESITNHKAMRISVQHVLENMMRASLLFTVCFYGNLLSLLYQFLKGKYQDGPFQVETDNKLLHLYLELANGELATKNIPTEAGHYSPHYVAMLEACRAAGVDTRKVEVLVSTGSVKKWAEAQRIPWVVESYLNFSLDCCSDYETALATIALRELTLSMNFQIIHDHLPKDARYDKYRTFLATHIEVDSGEHGQLMAEALASIDRDQADRVMDIMIQFYSARKKIYDECLDEGSILDKFSNR